jgi:small subunit ribosomal protein S4
MARVRTSRHKVSRRFGVDIYGTGGAALGRRLSVPPGGLPRGRRRPTEYGLDLQEKQKAKALYGVAEKQFRRYYAAAARQPGVAGENLLQFLERRLDNVVYRLGFARTRPMARQLINYGHICVDDQRVNSPSYLVRPGEQISLTEDATRITLVSEEVEAGRTIPPWLERQGASGRVLQLPRRADVELPINEERIVAFYSR